LVQGRLVNKMMNMQRSIMKNTSSRVKIVNEVLQGMRVVKSYAWESPFKEAIKAVRYARVTCGLHDQDMPFR
jgi:ATP-binding cassette subfamily C (CFTR/MRP) protein 1